MHYIRWAVNKTIMLYDLELDYHICKPRCSIVPEICTCQYVASHVVVIMPNSIPNMPLVPSGFGKVMKAMVAWRFRWGAKGSFQQG
jgi:hypothetical protein